MIRLVQCWDDGVEDDIRVCDILRAAKAKATFNLNAGSHRYGRMGEWVFRETKTVRKLALGELTRVYQGFTIANHTLTHPHATKIPLSKWRDEVVDGRKWLQDIFSAPIHGFVYPFGDKDEATAQVVREAGHLYARGTVAQTPCFPPADPMVFNPDGHFLAGDFWQRYEKAKASGSSVFYFWGHSYELVTEQDWQKFTDQINRLSADPDAVWADLPELFLPQASS